MVMIEYHDVQCADLTFAAMPPAYRQQAAGSVEGGNRSHGSEVNPDPNLTSPSP